MKTNPFAALLATLLVLTFPAFGALEVASPFTDHMVLQRERPVPIWGTAGAGAKVTVEFAGQSKSATADRAGQWRVSLDPMKASAEGRTLKLSAGADSSIELNDVLIGEVWLASGQSNMEFPMSKSQARWAGVDHEEQEIAAASYPQIRIFTGAKTCSLEPRSTVPGEWEICTPENAPAFSAISYFFARDLHQELEVPVGMISLSFGASTAQAWIRREAIARNPKLRPVLEEFDAKVKSYTPPTEEELEQWQAAVEKAKAENRRAPRRPKADPAQDQHNPTVLFNGMIAPVCPYAIRGVIWYQGESITEPKELFPLWNETLIEDWRALWSDDFPFYFCQLAALDSASNSPQVRAWQAEALKLPKTGMAVTIDIGDRKNVHPKNKQEAAARLARIALAQTYGREIEFSAPILEGMKIEGDVMRLQFSHVADGLVARDGPLKTFEIAGADGNFVPAEAEIEGDTVVVRSAEVAAPRAARYAWSRFPEGSNLYNTAGLPAAPFHTGSASE